AEGYTEDIIHTFEQRLKTIFSRSINQVHVLDFVGLTEGMRQTLVGRMSDTEMGLDVVNTLCFQLGGARRRMTWRQFILALGLHIVEEMVEDGFQAYWLGVDTAYEVSQYAVWKLQGDTAYGLSQYAV
nr:hypothetical protein [Tanacetum cinerariifolium]